jgi:hypothetical protein
VDNFDSNKINVIATLTTDIALLLIMLIGLLRLRLTAGGALSLGRILWKQVQWRQLSLTVTFLNLNFCLSGSYLAVACDRRRGPCISASSYPFFFSFLLTHSYFTSDIHDFKPEW